MKISIVVPLYNVEHYIAVCLQSVMRQTYQGPLECILVDDCGADGSMSIAEGLIAEYDGLDFIRERQCKGNSIWNASSALFAKSVIQKVPKAYQTYKMAGDKLFWIELALCGGVVHLNKRLNFYRRHLGSVTHKRVLDGTLYREEYSIMSYMHKQGLVKGVCWLDAWLYYVARIMTEEFDSESIRMDLLELWGVKGRRGILRYKLRRKLVMLNKRYLS